MKCLSLNNSLIHHGIKGQRWGVRRFQYKDMSYTPAGDERYNNRKPDGSIKAVNGSASKPVSQNNAKSNAGKKKYYRIVSDGDISLAEKRKLFGKKGSGNYEIRSNNKKVGKMIVDDYDDHRHIDWVGIDDKYKRKGYGQKALDLIISDGKAKGLKYIELDAAGLDPAARHIYEKKGFKAVDEIKKDDVWDTLLTMRKEL